MGVGRPPGRQNPVDFVLHEFAARERDDVDEMVERAADAALSLVVEGLAVTQDRYNRGARRPVVLKRPRPAHAEPNRISPLVKGLVRRTRPFRAVRRQ